MRIVYNSFNGRYSDSPAAVHQGLLRRGDEHEHLWLRDPMREGGFPAGTSTRQIHTPSAVAALESADLVISDSHLEMDWTKKPGARYVQTWHGTPLKRVHADIVKPLPGMTEWLSLDVDRWDVLLSPNRHSTAALRSAFGWQGPVLETGYPRNDVLLSADAPGIRARVRHDLSLTGEQTAVLYTPTFRDDILAQRGPEAETALALDAAFIEGLEQDCVLLVRLHYKLRGRAVLPEHPRVRDVSHHPDVADLYLAADAMVTDYSSTMFAVAVTGKPLIFFPYDLDRYQRLRGFYFDLSEQAPGPVVRTPEQLLDSLRNPSALAREHAPAYRRFQERFCHLDDGHATRRFLDHVIPTC